MRIVSTADAASTTTSAGSRRRTSRVTSGAGTVTAGRQRIAQQLAAEEEPGQHQEHVDPARHPAEPDVERSDQQDGDAAEAVQVVSVEAGLAAAHAGGRVAAAAGATFADAGWRGVESVMVDRQST